MIRLFAALALPPSALDALIGLGEGVPGARWLRDDQMHLTLRFIGEVDRAAFEDVVHALGEVEADAFELALAGVGHFPPRGAPKVLWAGVRQNPALNLLQSRIESALGVQSGARFLAGEASDLSTGGLFVATSDPLPLGTELTLGLLLPDGHRVVVDAVVSWARGPHSGGAEGMGVRFVRVSRDDAAAIARHATE